MVLDLSSLRKAVGSLDNAIRVASSQEFVKGLNPAQKDVVRAGVIQNFEFTFELCWKFMKRWLEHNASGPSVDGITRKELFRLAAENRLIKEAAVWFDFSRARNETAHTYDAKKAGDIYETAVAFAADAKALLKALESRND